MYVRYSFLIPLYNLLKSSVEAHSHVHKTTYGPQIDTALYVKLLMQGKSITWASGRGLGPGNLDLFWHQIAFTGPEKISISSVNPLPLALVMDLPATKALRTGSYKSLIHK
jgi:hypothetical protein